jgi:SAM-dependent methyltransferase
MPLITDPHHDPLGQALLDYWQGNQAAAVTVHADLALHDDLPAAYFFRSWEEMPAWEQAALDHCQGQVLDVGAGAGCHSLVLQARGHAVTALDISPGAVTVMAARGIQAVHADIMTWDGPPADTILFMMNGIGLAGTLRQLQHLLQHLRTLLMPGGQILLDSSDVAYLYTHSGLPLPPETEGYYGEVTYHMAYGEIIGAPFGWVYVDIGQLARIARLAGYGCEVITTGPHFEYTARLVRM